MGGAALGLLSLPGAGRILLALTWAALGAAAALWVVGARREVSSDLARGRRLVLAAFALATLAYVARHEP